MSPYKFNKIKDYTIILIAAVAISYSLASFNSCSRNTKILDLNNKIEQIKQDYEYKLQTISHKTDTIRDTICIYRFKPSKPKYIYLKDSIKPSIIDSNEFFKYKLYLDTLRDSNVVIWSKNKVLGQLIESQTDYKLLVPFMVIDTVTVNNSYIKYPKHTFGVGFTMSNNSFSPIIKYSYKKNNFILGYDLINKTPNIGYIRNIFAYDNFK